MMRNKKLAFIYVGGLLLYLFTPLIATLLYSFATKWGATIIPDGFTFTWYSELFSDPRFIMSLQRSFLVSGITCFVSLMIMVPTVFIVIVYFPNMEKLMKVIITIPFAMPGIVLSVGLIKLYSGEIFPIAGTIWILIGAYFVIILPFMYQGIRSAFRTIDVKRLMEAAQLLGASELEAFRFVIFPNLMKGILVSVLLSFSLLMGEFVVSNLLAGGNFETVQVYLFNQKGRSGHYTSAIVMTYFTFILIISFVMIQLERKMMNIK